MEYGLNQKIKIVGVTEALGLSAAELAGWNVLSIRARINDLPLNFPGAHRTLTLHFDDVLADCAEDGEYAATPEDIQAALTFAREIRDEPLLIHCAAGISRSTALAWIIVYDRLRGLPNVDAVRLSFNIVRTLRPILAPNKYVLRLGIEALVPPGDDRVLVRYQFADCLFESGRSFD